MKNEFEFRGYILENENQLFEIILEIFNLNEHDYKYALKNESIKDLHDLFVIYLKENGLSVLLEESHTSIFDFVLKAYLKNKYHIYLNVIPNQLDSIPKNSPIFAVSLIMILYPCHIAKPLPIQFIGISQHLCLLFFL